MPDGPARPGKAHALGRAKHRRVELKGLGGALYGEARVTRRYESGIGPGLSGAVIRSSFRTSVRPFSLYPICVRRAALHDNRTIFPRDSGADGTPNTQRRCPRDRLSWPLPYPGPSSPSPRDPCKLVDSRPQPLGVAEAQLVCPRRQCAGQGTLGMRFIGDVARCGRQPRRPTDQRYATGQARYQKVPSRCVPIPAACEHGEQMRPPRSSLLATTHPAVTRSPVEAHAVDTPSLRVAGALPGHWPGESMRAGARVLDLTCRS